METLGTGIILTGSDVLGAGILWCETRGFVVSIPNR